MAKRLRLLIYEGPEEWITIQRANDGVQGRLNIDKRPGRQAYITSIELDPLRITLVEVCRVLWKEWWENRRERKLQKHGQTAEGASKPAKIAEEVEDPHA